MLFTHENTKTVIDMNYVHAVERDHETVTIKFKDGETAFLACQTDYNAEEILCLLQELVDKKRTSLWVHEYWCPKSGWEMEHIMEY